MKAAMAGAAGVSVDYLTSLWPRCLNRSCKSRQSPRGTSFVPLLIEDVLVQVPAAPTLCSAGNRHVMTIAGTLRQAPKAELQRQLLATPDGVPPTPVRKVRWARWRRRSSGLAPR